MKNFLIILLMIVIIAGTGYGVYYQIDNHNKKNESSNEVENETKEEVGENLDVNSDTVTVLMDKFNILKNDIASEEEFGYFYLKDNYNVDNIDNQVKLLLARKQVIEKYKDTFTYDYSTEIPSVKISNDLIKQEMINIFGENVAYTDEDVTVGGCDYWSGKYDINTKQYTLYEPQCGGALIPYIETKIVGATKYSDRLEIIEKMAYFEANPASIDSGEVKTDVYTHPADKKLIGTVDNDDNVFELYNDQLNSYKYTFNYENGNYYFESIELVK